jgi:hypothetical protein
MRYRPVAALTLALALAGAATAQQPAKVQITGVRFGFPGRQGNVVKAGAWAPVYVDLAANKERVFPVDGEVRVLSHDSDDMENVYSVHLPQMEIGDAPTVLAYARTPNLSGEIAVSVHLTADNRVVLPPPNASSANGVAAFNVVGPGAYLYVIAGVPGSRVPGLQAALNPPPKAPAPGQPDPNADPNAGGDPADPTHGRSFGSLGGVNELPTVWFGYSAVDLLILHTADDKFVKDLLNDQTGRKEALAEWVRRGGRLVISVGSNQQLVQELLGKLQILPVSLGGTLQRAEMTGVKEWVGGNVGPFQGSPVKDDKTRRNPVEYTRVDVEPRRGVEVLAREKDETDRTKDRPVIVQAAAGRGRVVLVAFDLETGPFTDWAGQKAFWQKLQLLMVPQDNGQAANANVNQRGGGYGAGWGGDRLEVGTHLDERLESFDEVPVISFGWVALFIFIYILVVGPLDYFFLKKVVKRLELTWVTFPAVVLVVSAVAYFSAYYIKGNDLRVNKIDVVDVVAEPGEKEGQPAESTWAAGTTWFTLFSPRIQNYNVAIEPAYGKWAPEPVKGASPLGSSTITWLGKPEPFYGGMTRTGSPSLFRRAYEYEEKADALKGVPIQVWSTKSFTASWQTRLGEKSLFSAELSHPEGKEDRLSGTITNRLPVALDDTVLCYRGQVYYFEPRKLPPGPTRIDDLVRPDRAQNRLADWYGDARSEALSAQNSANSYDPRFGGGGSRRYPGQGPQQYGALLKHLLFNDLDPTVEGQPHLRNSLMRDLDQSWRLKDPRSEEVIVIGRVGTEKAGQKLTAEETSQDAVSPSRLWLGTLPSSGKPREPLAGVLFQETYVRVFLPVEPIAKAGKQPEGK